MSGGDHIVYDCGCIWWLDGEGSLTQCGACADATAEREARQNRPSHDEANAQHQIPRRAQSAPES